MKKRVKAIALLVVGLAAALAILGSLGCVSESTVTDEDRAVVYYNREAWLLVGAASATVGADPSAQIAATALIASKYGIPASEHLVKTWGPPKKAPAPISEEAVKTAIDKSKESHAVPWWQVAGTTALGVISVLLGLGSKFARFLPGGGQLWGVASATFEAIEGFMSERKEAGDTSTADALAKALEKAHADPRLRPIADKILFEVQKRTQA